MNREIKFRAWHKDLKKMFKIGQITLEKGTWNFEPNDRDFIGMSIPYQPSFVLMQYTGLHDKNGKEIYEGDILKFSDVDTAIVEWNEKYSSFIVKPIQDYYFDSEILGHAIEYSNVEVIGNVFEKGILLNDSEKSKKN